MEGAPSGRRSASRAGAPTRQVRQRQHHPHAHRVAVGVEEPAAGMPRVQPRISMSTPWSPRTRTARRSPPAGGRDLLDPEGVVEASPAASGRPPWQEGVDAVAGHHTLPGGRRRADRSARRSPAVHVEEQPGGHLEVTSSARVGALPASQLSKWDAGWSSRCRASPTPRSGSRPTVTACRHQHGGAAHHPPLDRHLLHQRDELVEDPGVDHPP